MSHMFGSRSRRSLASLFCLFAFVLFVGSLTAAAGSDTGAKKGCDPKACTKTCPMMMKASSQDATQEEKPDAALAFNLKDFATVEGYTCPMHPEIKSEKSGKCPECGMKLVKGDFYKTYTCAMKECTHPCVHPKPGKCCGQDLHQTLITKDEIYLSARLADEYFCPMHSEVISDAAGKCPKCGMKLEMKTVQKPLPEPSQMMSYVCPMHSDQASDQPGKCSKCGMALKRMSNTAEEKGSTQ